MDQALEGIEQAIRDLKRSPLPTTRSAGVAEWDRIMHGAAQLHQRVIIHVMAAARAISPMDRAAAMDRAVRASELEAATLRRARDALGIASPSVVLPTLPASVPGPSGLELARAGGQRITPKHF